jgi:4-hydroxy-2-oxoheptanedioate aldolase
MTVYPNRTKRRLHDGDVVLGMVLRQARTVDIAMIAQSCDFDFLSIDLEHTSIDLDTAGQIACAALPVGVTPLVRVPSVHSDALPKMLDAGAQGAIVPHVETAGDARAIVERATYPPSGSRSATMLPHLEFDGLPVGEAAVAVNAETLIVVMLESAAAIANAGAIAEVPGVDVLLIGIHDLCAEMGIPGQLGHPSILEAFRTVTEACRAHGKFAGMAGIHDSALNERLFEMGARYVHVGVDANFLKAGASARTAALRKMRIELR